MNILRTTILLVLGAVCPILADETDPQPVTLHDAKELGRTKSRFLKAHQAARPTSGTAPQANVAHYQQTIASVLNKSCIACHGPERSEGRLRVDQLNANLLSGPDIEQWREIYNVLSNSEMPPEDEEEYALADSDRANIVDWLSAEMNKASVARRNTTEHSSFRRLTKYEYDYALQDLLGLSHTLATRLPPETASEDGFKNSSDMLQMTSMQFETYREIALKALQRAIVVGDRPTPVTYVISMEEVLEKAPQDKVFDPSDKDYDKKLRRQHLIHRETGQAFHFSGGKSVPKPDAVPGELPAVSPVVLAMPRSNELKMNLDRFLPDDGIMRVRIRAGRSTDKPNEFASLRLGFSAHTSNNANFSNTISQRDLPVTAPADNPEFIDFYIQLSDIQRNPFRKLERTFPRRDEFLHIRNESNAGGGEEPLHVLMDYIEISAPFYEHWPPKTHSAIFIDSAHRDDEAVYGREVLSHFTRRAWRRPATPAELEQLMALFAKYRPRLDTFEEAMLEVLATVLAAPEFLYLTQRDSESESDETITDLELASRLSFFLWSSIPDATLLELAEQGKLNEPSTLAAQVKRMLADPRARRFSEHFVQQWLGLDGLNAVNHITDESLKAAIHDEPIALFQEVLDSNRTVMDFLHVDYITVNERLAKHYHIPNVYGPHFRKVAITPQSHRGGVLTHAVVLAMNSDGNDSHPLKRGVWMLERVLHDPPPPPPPNVPEVDLTDPEILKMTLKERIEDHRNKPACASCHSRIDPWGIAFENYNALGVYRTQIKNKPVDATSELFNKQKLAGMDGLKRYLLMERQDQFARAMVHKLTAYALGRPLSFNDHAALDSITTEFRQRGDRLGELVNLIIRSELFHAK